MFDFSLLIQTHRVLAFYNSHRIIEFSFALMLKDVPSMGNWSSERWSRKPQLFGKFVSSSLCSHEYGISPYHELVQYLCLGTLLVRRFYIFYHFCLGTRSVLSLSLSFSSTPPKLKFWDLLNITQLRNKLLKWNTRDTNANKKIQFFLLKLSKILIHAVY